MAPELGRIGPIVIRTYTLFLDIAILAGLGLLAWTGWRRHQRPAAWIDAGLGALAGGVILGRLGHVALHWVYFNNHRAEIFELWRGGLDWHGAVLGGLIGFVLVAFWRKVPIFAALDVIAIGLPLGAALTYTGCLMVSCGHGREVEALSSYPWLLAAELPDLFGVIAPRLASQTYGIAWSLFLVGLSLLLSRNLKKSGMSFFIVLGLLAMGAFAIGFTRGDLVPMIGPLRLDQVLDLTMIVPAAAGVLFSARPEHPYVLYGPAGFVRR